MVDPKVVMVTGGSGLVGRGLHWAVTEGGLGHPDEKWVFLGSKDGNLTEEEAVKALYGKHRPTHVVNLAAMVGGLYRNMRQPAEFYYNNIRMNTYVIHYAHLFNCKKIISCLSSCIMPDGIRIPINEDDLHMGPPHVSNFPYAYSKRMIDIQNRAYHQQYGKCFTGFIPVNIFGPEDNYCIEDGHVVPGLIHKTYLAQKNNEPLNVWGSGVPLRQFVYSRDLGRILVWMVRSYDHVDPLLTVGENCETTIKQMVDFIVEATDFKGEVRYDTTRSDGQYRKTCSNAKLRSFLPDFKFTPLREAIKETCDWFKANYETARK